MSDTRGRDLAIGGLPFSEIVGALRRAWAASTSYNPLTWTTQNPGWGQCAVTAVTLYRIFGGDVLRNTATLPDGEEIVHYFNRLSDSTIIDVTHEQFPKGTTFTLGRRGRPHGVSVMRRSRLLLDTMEAEWSQRTDATFAIWDIAKNQ